MPKKPETPVRVSVLDRRLNDPFGEPSIPIQFKDPQFIARWFNGAISTDKIWRAQHVKGWATVTPAMLVDVDQIGGFDLSPAGYITRGERGHEVLMCMPRAVYDQIQTAKSRKNLANMGDSARTKAEVVTAAGDKYGDEAADFLTRTIGNVTDQYERIERKPLEDE